jgi:hypothetical protein
MVASRRFAVCTVSLFAGLSSAPVASAQGWVTLPNGQLSYVTNNTTSGFFQCGDPFYLIGTCLASGNSITLGSGASTMTFTFHGLTQVVTALAVQKPVKIGTVSKSFSGPGPFLFPTSKPPGPPLFFFRILVSSSLPLVASGYWEGGYLPVSRTTLPRICCDGLDNVIYMPVSPPPPGVGYGAVVYGDFTGTTFSVNDEEMTIMALVSIVPEPGTIWLTATGLLGLLPLARRRRTRHARPK